VRLKVKIPPGIKQTILSWELPRGMLIEVYNRLNTDLAENHKTLLRSQIVPFANVFEYNFTLPADWPTPPGRHFFFAVERDNGQQVLRIRFCRLTTS
jgi:hypothetical protein